MNFAFCIMFCLVATTLVECNDKEFCTDMKSFLDQSYYPTTGLAKCRNQLQSLIKLLFYPPLVYNNKKYVISNFAHKNVAEADKYCTAFGGYLAEIDDNDEYKALQSFVLNSPIKNLVIIGGSDAANEGTWIFPRTGLPVKFSEWALNQPDNGGDEDCLSLWKPYGGKMNDETCGLLNPDNRFMCEISNTF